MKTLNTFLFFSAFSILAKTSTVYAGLQPVGGRIPVIVQNAENSTLEQCRPDQLPEDGDFDSPHVASDQEMLEIGAFALEQRAPSVENQYIQYFVCTAEELQRDFNDLANQGILPGNLDPRIIPELKKDLQYKRLVTQFLEAKHRYEFAYKVNFKILQAVLSLGMIEQIGGMPENQQYLQGLERAQAELRQALLAYQAPKIEEIRKTLPGYSVEADYMPRFRYTQEQGNQDIERHLAEEVERAQLANFVKSALKADPVYKQHIRDFCQATARAAFASLHANQIHIQFYDHLTQEQRNSNELYTNRLDQECRDLRGRLQNYQQERIQALEPKAPTFAAPRHSIERDYMPRFTYTTTASDVREYMNLLKNEKLDPATITALKNDPQYMAYLVEYKKSFARRDFARQIADQLEGVKGITRQQQRLNGEYLERCEEEIRNHTSTLFDYEEERIKALKPLHSIEEYCEAQFTYTPEDENRDDLRHRRYLSENGISNEDIDVIFNAKSYKGLLHFFYRASKKAELASARARELPSGVDLNQLKRNREYIELLNSNKDKLRLLLEKRRKDLLNS